MVDIVVVEDADCWRGGCGVGAGGVGDPWLEGRGSIAVWHLQWLSSGVLVKVRW